LGRRCGGRGGRLVRHGLALGADGLTATQTTRFGVERGEAGDEDGRELGE
jgi:hypothetical protein